MRGVARGVRGVARGVRGVARGVRGVHAELLAVRFSRFTDRTALTLYRQLHRNDSSLMRDEYRFGIVLM